MMEVVLTTGAVRRAKLQSNHHEYHSFQSATVPFRSSEAVPGTVCRTSSYHLKLSLFSGMNRLKTYLFSRLFTH